MDKDDFTIDPPQVAQRRRPNPAEWLWYTWGGRLSPSLRDWVLKDTTSWSWVPRHMLRSLVFISPFAIPMLLFMPDQFWIRGTAVLGGTCVGVFYGLAYIVETTETRLLKAGFPRGLGEHIRQHRSTEAHTAGVARRRAAALERRRRKMPT